MKKPINPEMTPKGGWSITFPGTGHKITSPHPSEFLRLCKEHMTINNIPVMGGWKDDMLNMACEQNPDLPCYDVDAPERSVTSDDIWRFLTTLWKSFEQGAAAVSEEEAERRAAICVACPKLGRTSCTSGCGKLVEVLTTLTLGRKPKHIESLHKASCGVCGCEVSSLINYPLSVLKEVDEKMNFKIGEYDPKCWKLDPI